MRTNGSRERRLRKAMRYLMDLKKHGDNSVLLLINYTHRGKVRDILGRTLSTKVGV